MIMIAYSASMLGWQWIRSHLISLNSLSKTMILCPHCLAYLPPASSPQHSHARLLWNAVVNRGTGEGRLGRPLPEHLTAIVTVAVKVLVAVACPTAFKPVLASVQVE